VLHSHQDHLLDLLQQVGGELARQVLESDHDVYHTALRNLVKFLLDQLVQDVKLLRRTEPRVIVAELETGDVFEYDALLIGIQLVQDDLQVPDDKVRHLQLLEGLVKIAARACLKQLQGDERAQQLRVLLQLLEQLARDLVAGLLKEGVVVVHVDNVPEVQAIVPQELVQPHVERREHLLDDLRRYLLHLEFAQPEQEVETLVLVEARNLLGHMLDQA